MKNFYSGKNDCSTLKNAFYASIYHFSMLKTCFYCGRSDFSRVKCYFYCSMNNFATVKSVFYCGRSYFSTVKSHLYESIWCQKGWIGEKRANILRNHFKLQLQFLCSCKIGHTIKTHLMRLITIQNRI